jgi:hypothetical protein
MPRKWDNSDHYAAHQAVKNNINRLRKDLGVPIPPNKFNIKTYYGQDKPIKKVWTKSSDKPQMADFKPKSQPKQDYKPAAKTTQQTKQPYKKYAPKPIAFKKAF